MSATRETGSRIAEISLGPARTNTKGWGAPPPATAASGDSVIKLKGFRTIASYNQIHSSSDTILVPGSPPLWALPVFPLELRSDSSTYSESSSFLHSLTAVKALQPDYKFSALDVMCSEDCLRQLTRAATAARLQSPSKSFSVEISYIGLSTVAISYLRHADDSGGATYERAFAARSTVAVDEWCGVDAGDHYRIVTFNLMGLRILEQCKVHARFPPQPTVSLTTGSHCIEALLNRMDLSTPAPKTASVPRLAPPAKRDPATAVSVLRTLLPLSPDAHNVVFDVRANARRPTSADAFRKLLWSPAPTLYLPWHQHGEFHGVERVDAVEVREELRNHQEDLKAVAAALKELRLVACKAKRVALVGIVGGGRIEVFARDGRGDGPSQLGKLFQ